ncbi:ATP-binding cassette domain-containing protein [Streptomyces sp. NPDC056160]|uniref:ATP-binding cassette domain-containing protein n=1 Tax=Streptomyces sp. NPDC056160 TaxID=3345731 RepID=UPI0035D99E05
MDFVVQPGAVTGFLGPGGPGRSTAIRMIVSLGAPTSGSATVNRPPTLATELRLQEVGAPGGPVDPPGRSACNQLRVLALLLARARRKEPDSEVGG